MVYEKILNNQEDLEEAIRLVKPDESDIMLDLACGAGETTIFFAPKVKSVIAADADMEALKNAQTIISEQREFLNVTYREADAQDLPFPAGAFSLICRRGEFHHFTDLKRAFDEFFRVLRWHGRLCIIDTLKPANFEAAAFMNRLHRLRDPAHTRSHRREEWIESIEATDFVIHSIQTFGKRQDFRKWCADAVLPPSVSTTLQCAFLDAAPAVKEFFQVEVFAGEVESFVQPAILIFASHPAKPAR